jgi:hypothetical protein
MNTLLRSKHISIINRQFKKICNKNNLQIIKTFYEGDYLDYYYKIINKNKSMDISDINQSITSVFHNYLYNKKAKKEILLWFISLDIISNKSYNDIYYDLCIKNNIEKALFLYELNLINKN